MTPYLNKFRGKPAIPKFDKPFTPNHTSSPYISTDVGSVFQEEIYSSFNLRMISSFGFGSNPYNLTPF